MATRNPLHDMPARGIRQLVLLLCIAVIPALLLARRQGAEAHPSSLRTGEITPDSAKRFPMANAQFVDARSRDEYTRGHPPGAVRLNSAEWDSLIAGFYDAWEPGRAMIVYGRARSDEASTVAHRLRTEAKLENIFVLQGIWEEWPRH